MGTTVGNQRAFPPEVFAATLRLLPPLVVRNVLPCGMRLRVTPLALSPSKARDLGWPELPSTMGVAHADNDGDPRRTAIAAKLRGMLAKARPHRHHT